MLLGIFENVENEEKENAIEDLVASSSPRQDYFFMVIISISMATLGILLNSIVIVIGSMLIAPVLYPVLGTGMGIAILDFDDLFIRSLYTLGQSIVISLLFSALFGFLFFTGELETLRVVRVITGIESLVMYSVIALAAGFAASLSLVKPTLSESFPGVAVSASLVPPLAVAGLAMSTMNLQLTSDMLLLFGANVLGIVIASAVIFALMQLHVKRRLAERKVEEEREQIQQENQ